MSFEALRSAIAWAKSPWRQTSLNPDPTITLTLREAEALVKVVKALVRAREQDDLVGRTDAMTDALFDCYDALDELEAME